MKRCTLCGESKPISEFYTCGFKNGKRQFHSRCKLCVRERRRQYHWEHLDAERTRSNDWRKENKGKANEALRRWRLNHPGRMRFYTRAWEMANPERVHEFHRERYQRYKAAGPDITDEQWAELKARCGNKCLGCGKPESEVALVADHIRPLSAGGLNAIENRQPLCRVCNSKKHTYATDYRKAS